MASSYKYLQITPILNAWPTVFLLSIFGCVLALLLSFTRTLEFSSTTKILIAPKLGTTDAYTVGRSAELIADNLSTILYTSTFYDDVFNSGYDIDRTYFPDDVIKFRKKWNKVVSASVSRSSGILTIRAYHPDVTQAEEIARAVAFVLVTKGWNYVPGVDIAIQVVDEPVNSRYPVRPNLPVNAVSGLFLGLIGGSGFVLIRAERSRRRHQFIHEA